MRSSLLMPISYVAIGTSLRSVERLRKKRLIIHATNIAFPLFSVTCAAKQTSALRVEGQLQVRKPVCIGKKRPGKAQDAGSCPTSFF